MFLKKELQNLTPSLKFQHFVWPEVLVMKFLLFFLTNIMFGIEGAVYKSCYGLGGRHMSVQ